MKTRSAVIIGGGIAGLAAAQDLCRNGIAVTVLEAQNRLGGRINTIHDGNTVIELGAEFIHGESRPLLSTIKEAKLELQPVSDLNQVLENGHLKQYDLWDKAGEIFNRIDPNTTDISFRQFLVKQTDLDSFTATAMTLFVEGFNAAHADRISAQSLLKAEKASEQMNGSVQYRLTAGYSALVKFLASEIERTSGRIRMNALCQEIVWKSGHAEIRFESPGHPEVLSADAAIITLPIGVLKSDAIKFAPALQLKSELAHGLEFGNIVKVLFQFREPFWHNFGFTHSFDEAFPTWWNDSRSSVLVGWAGGSHADALSGKSKSELEQLGLDVLSRLFSTSTTLLRHELVHSHFWNWATDPFSRGAYSYIPVHGLGLPQLLAEPMAQTLYFAGEATVSDAQMGTVFGAFESGLRAARELMDSK